MWKIYEKEKDNMHTIFLVIKIMESIKTWEALDEMLIYEYATEKHLSQPYDRKTQNWDK